MSKEVDVATLEITGLNQRLVTIAQAIYIAAEEMEKTTKAIELMNEALTSATTQLEQATVRFAEALKELAS